MLANADKIKRNAYREGLLSTKDAAILSKSLVTLRADVPVTLDLEALEAAAAQPRRRERALHGAGVRGPGQGVRAGGGGRAAPNTPILTEPDAVSTAVEEARTARKVAVCFVR